METVTVEHSANPLYDVVVESREVVVRFSRDLFDNEAITRFLDYLELESIRKRSQLTGAEAEALADEIDRAGWTRLNPELMVK
ncbi:MAG: hypothetical protein AB1791_22750 [Chloroflexota bacterium]